MTFFVIRYGWRYPLPLCVAATGFFFGHRPDASSPANLLKLLEGGWFPLAHRHRHVHADDHLEAGARLDGRRACTKTPSTCELPRRRSSSARPQRVPGTAVFLGAEPGTSPNALLHNLKHNKVLHEQNLFVSVRHHERALDRLRPALRSAGAGPRLLAGGAALRLQERARRARGAAAAARPRHRCSTRWTTSYFLSRDIGHPDAGGGMALWREKLFAGMHRNAARRPTS
jgi:KUP system potassium uptake protein